MPAPTDRASARYFAVFGAVVLGVLVGAEVLCGCFPARDIAPTTPEQRAKAAAEAAAVAHLTADGGDAWRSSSAEASPEGDGWRVFVRREPPMPGGHATVLLDAEMNVTRHIRGR